MAKRRSDTKTQPRFRTDRFVEEGGKWFFFTREGTMEGPFEDMIEATIRLEKYISVMNSGILPDDSEVSLDSEAKESGYSR